MAQATVSLPRGASSGLFLGPVLQYGFGHCFLAALPLTVVFGPSRRFCELPEVGSIIPLKHESAESAGVLANKSAK